MNLIYPIFVKDRDGWMFNIASPSGLDYLETIDIEENEYIAWDVTGMSVEFYLDKKEIKVRPSLDKTQQGKLQEAILNYARLSRTSVPFVYSGDLNDPIGLFRAVERHIEKRNFVEGLSWLARILVNTLFLVPFKVRKFKEKYLGESVLAAGGTKGIALNENETVICRPKWIFAKRAVLILSDKRLVCGTWNIEINQIDDAMILLVKSFCVQGLVIKIKTKENEYYQFGLQYDPKWLDQKVLPFRIEEGKIGTSIFSIAVRLILLAYIIWIIFRWIKH